MLKTILELKYHRGFTLSENYKQIMEWTMDSLPEVTGILILDKDANIIDYNVNKYLKKKLEPILNRIVEEDCPAHRPLCIKLI